MLNACSLSPKKYFRLNLERIKKKLSMEKNNDKLRAEQMDVNFEMNACFWVWFVWLTRLDAFAMNMKILTLFYDYWDK